MAEQKIDTNRLAEIVPAAQAGDAEAFGEIYDILVAPIYRYTYYRVSNREQAEDLTESAFLKAWENIKKYKAKKGCPFSAWVFRIAHNLVIDYYRSHSKAEIVEIPDNLQSSDDPNANAQTRFEKRELRLAIRQLPDDQQQVIILKFINELENSEIAAVMGKTEGAIRIIQFRALGKLKDILDAPEEIAFGRLSVREKNA